MVGHFKKSNRISRILIALFLVALVVSIQTPSLTAVSWYDSDWSKRRAVTITNSMGETITNAQVYITVTYDSDMQTDFDDLRFTDSDGTTDLSYWIESYTPSTSAIVWIKIPEYTLGDNTIYMYYGNDSVSTTSDPDTTFIFWDTFDTDTSGDYTLEENATVWDTTNSQVNCTQTENSHFIAYATGKTESTGLVYEARCKSATPDVDNFMSIMFGRQDSDNFYLLRLRNGDLDQMELYKSVNASMTLLGTDSQTVSDDKWYIVKVHWVSPSQIDIWLDNTKLWEQTTSLESWTSGGYGWRDSISASGVESSTYKDWYRIRKYTGDQPYTFSIGDEEDKNHPPTLTFTGETNYETDGVHPDTGRQNSNFTFRIKYTDANNDPPTSIQLWLDEDLDGSYSSSEKHDLSEDDASDTDYTDGKIYQLTYQINPSGTMNYKFYATDGTDTCYSTEKTVTVNKKGSPKLPTTPKVTTTPPPTTTPHPISHIPQERDNKGVIGVIILMAGLLIAKLKGGI